MSIPGTNGINVGNVIASPNPGDIAVGQATQPANVGNIMQNMFQKMITLENVNKPVVSVQQPVIATQSQVQPQAQPQQPVVPQVQPQPQQPVKPDVGLFTPEVTPEPVVAQPDEPDMSDIPDDPKSENWKKVREALRTERKTLKTISQEYEATKSKLEKYEKGEAIPDVLAAKDAKLQEYEKYATIVNGRLSDEYQTLVAEPIKQKSSALDKLAQDYEVPDTIKHALLKKIVETDNERERNSLITKYFPDAIGASKVETLVKEMQQLGKVALDLENKPQETLQSLQAQYQEKKQKEAETIAAQFEGVSKGAWNKALEKTAQEGLFDQLILDPNDPEHNKQVELNQQRAAIQFGAAVKKLHENGLRTMPDDLAIGLARSIQLSIGAVDIARQLDAANQRIAELEGKSGMLANYLRPGVNNNGRVRVAPNATQDKGPLSPQQAAQRAAEIFRR